MQTLVIQQAISADVAKIRQFRHLGDSEANPQNLNHVSQASI